MRYLVPNHLQMVRLLTTAAIVAMPSVLFAQTLDNLPPVAPLPEMAAQPPMPPSPAPAPQAGAMLLPEVEVPSGPAASAPSDQSLLPVVPQQPTEAPAQPAKPAESVTPSAALDEPFSYGAFPSALMFAPSQIEAMKRVLNDYEMKRRLGTAGDIEVVEEQAPPPVIVPEPDAYPVFTLGSVAYRARNDWTVWVSGLKITPKTNDQEIRVVGVGPGLARLAWKPAYIDTFKRRVAENKLAKADALKHKATRPNTAVLDAQEGKVYFSLKPNQSFVPGYMATFEGKVGSPTLEKMEPLPVPGAEDVSAIINGDAAAQAQGETRDVLPPSATTGLAGDSIRRMYQKAGGTSVANPQDTLDTLLKNNQNINAVVPQRANPKAPGQP